MTTSTDVPPAVRPVRDLAELVAAFDLAGAQEAEPLDHTDWRFDQVRDGFPACQDVCLVAETPAGEQVGAALAFRDEGGVRVRLLGVAASQRGSGVARRLLDAIGAACERAGDTRCYLGSVPSAVGFYAATGMRLVEQVPGATVFERLVGARAAEHVGSLDATVAACRELIGRRFPQGDEGAAAMLLGDGSVLTGTAPEVPNSSVEVCHETEPFCAAYRLGLPVVASVCLHREPDGRDVVLSPCGVCRERLAQHGPDVLVAVAGRTDATTVVWRRLRDVLPDYWLSAFPEDAGPGWLTSEPSA